MFKKSGLCREICSKPPQHHFWLKIILWLCGCCTLTSWCTGKISRLSEAFWQYYVWCVCKRRLRITYQIWGSSKSETERYTSAQSASTFSTSTFCTKTVFNVFVSVVYVSASTGWLVPDVSSQLNVFIFEDPMSNEELNITWSACSQEHHSWSYAYYIK